MNRALNVVFRVDASLQIGNGHFMRCLTLARELCDRGAHCHVICQEAPGHLGALVESAGHRLSLLPFGNCTEFVNGTNDLFHAHWLGRDWQEDAELVVAALGDRQYDWLIVDHYGLDASWEHKLKAYCGSLMVIDDLADRPHDCDLLLDQNLSRTSADYGSLVPHDAELLTGPDYALLRPEFRALREYSLRRRRGSRFQQIFVSMGGVDQTDFTSTALRALRGCHYPPGCRVVVVMGAHAPWLSKVRALAEEMPVPCEVKVNVSDMARLMAESDLAIGAAGSTSWERCCLGLPSIVLSMAENQNQIAAALEREGMSRVVASREEDAIVMQIRNEMNSVTTDWLRNAADAAASACDGLGARRVADRIHG